jgi:threonine dehydrogenase-like Zn-dependent dehydrogenase
MKALRFEKGELRLVSDLDVPHRPGEALVRVTLAGICNTDLEIVGGYADFCGTPGHEFVGVVEGSPHRSQIGARVVGEINAGCGDCSLCRSGDPRHCPQRTVLGIANRDGAFAEYLSLPPLNLLVVPDRIPDRAAVFVEPLAAACEILEQVEVTPSHRVIVLGDGKLGQLIARVLATTGCRLTLVGKHPDKLKLATSAGIETALVRTGDNDRADVVVEASGSPAGIRQALEMVRPRGTIVVKSTFRETAEIDISRVVVNEISLVGSRCGRFTKALELLSRGVGDLEPMITEEFPLAMGIEAFRRASSPGAMKVLLAP